jgi:hypothetical protein
MLHQEEGFVRRSGEVWYIADAANCYNKGPYMVTPSGAYDAAARGRVTRDESSVEKLVRFVLRSSLSESGRRTTRSHELT